ncbi:MAG: PaaI family thioesterase [Pseudomonadota bacterium]
MAPAGPSPAGGDGSDGTAALRTLRHRPPAAAKAPLDPLDLDPDFDALAWRAVRGDGFNAYLGPAAFARAGEDTWYGALTLERQHINVGGVCHGGVLMSLADITMGTATFEAGGGHPCATIEMNSHFVAAAKAGQPLVCRATQVRRTSGLSFMAAELAAGGRLVLRASGIWKYLSSRSAGQSGP